MRDDEIKKIVAQLMDLQNREDTLLPSLRGQLAEVDKAIDNLLDAIQQGLLSKSTKKRLDDLEAQKEDLELSIVQAELQRPRYTQAQMLHYIDQFKYVTRMMWIISAGLSTGL